MKKYFLSSVLGLFLLAGAGLLFTATGENPEKKSACCSSAKVETVQAVNTSTACGSAEATSAKATKGACTGSTPAVQTAQSSSSASGCVGTKAAACTGTKTQSAAKDCTTPASSLRAEQVQTP